MTEGTAPPPPSAPPPEQDPLNFSIVVLPDKWSEIPTPGGPDWFIPEERYRRDANAYAYRQHGKQKNWERYLVLGFFAFDDCHEWDKYWRNRKNDPLELHRAIWYNFMSHVNNEIDIPIQLNNWAMQVSHAYLNHFDPDSLDIDTFQYTWATMPRKTSMDIDQDQEQEWIPVSNRRRGRSPPTGSTTDLLFDTSSVSVPGFNLLFEKNDGTANSPIRNKTSNSATESNIAKPTPPQGSPPSDMTDSVTGSVTTDTNTSEQTRGAQWTPNPITKTNDGTHRITVKWKLASTEYTIDQMETNKSITDSAIHQLLTSMFRDTDGHFYRWESEDLLQAYPISQMTAMEARNFISPNLTFVRGSSMLIFGVRFGFTTSPAKWRQQPYFQETVESKQVTVLVSNSKSTSGKLVIAGYILLKAPNTTHRQRYTQHLRSQLPEVTPFFDIVKLFKTPMDQSIPYLAIQCGEQHVVPLCQALLQHLTGRRTALFLPRYAVTTMTEDKVKQHFEFHHKWVKSLREIDLSPSVFHLDQLRKEHGDNGTVCDRSTRAWAATLTLPDGITPALCDVVNGAKENGAYLLAPVHYFESAKEQWRTYRSRLFPSRQREKQFRDNIQGLPDIIHITTSILPHISFLEQMSAADVWRQAPQSVRSVNQEPQALPIPPRPISRSRSSQSVSRHHHRSPSTSCASIPEESDDESATSDPFPALPTQAHSNVSSGYNDDRSTDSTHSSTRASNQYQSKFHDLEQILRKQQNALDATGKITSDRLSCIEQQLSQVEELDRKISAVGVQLTNHALSQQTTQSSIQAIEAQAKELQTQTQELQHRSDKKIDTLGTTVLQVMNTMLEMREQFDKMSLVMQRLASHNDAQQVQNNSKRERSQEALPATSPNEAFKQMTSSNASVASQQSRQSDESSQSTTCLHSPRKKKLHSDTALTAEDDDAMDTELHNDLHIKGTAAVNTQDAPVNRRLNLDEAPPSSLQLRLVTPTSPVLEVNRVHQLSASPMSPLPPAVFTPMATQLTLTPVQTNTAAPLGPRYEATGLDGAPAT